MKKFPIILLLLMLFPIIWNGVGLFHHLVEHTHTFCENHDHEHSTVHECMNICHITQNHHHNQLPSEIDFHELKQYVNNCSPLDFPVVLITSTALIAESSALHDRTLSDDIFRPPIF